MRLIYFWLFVFRNYLDYVEESVADWTKEEDAKYQAHMLSKEIQRMREEEEMASRAAEKRQKGSAKRSASKAIVFLFFVLPIFFTTS